MKLVPVACFRFLAWPRLAWPLLASPGLALAALWPARAAPWPTHRPPLGTPRPHLVTPKGCTLAALWPPKVSLGHALAPLWARQVQATHWPRLGRSRPAMANLGRSSHPLATEAKPKRQHKAMDGFPIAGVRGKPSPGKEGMRGLMDSGLRCR